MSDLGHTGAEHGKIPLIDPDTNLGKAVQQMKLLEKSINKAQVEIEASRTEEEAKAIIIKCWGEILDNFDAIKYATVTVTSFTHPNMTETVKARMEEARVKIREIVMKQDVDPYENFTDTINKVMNVTPEEIGVL